MSFNSRPFDILQANFTTTINPRTGGIRVRSRVKGGGGSIVVCVCQPWTCQSVQDIV